MDFDIRFSLITLNNNLRFVVIKLSLAFFYAVYYTSKFDTFSIYLDSWVVQWYSSLHVRGVQVQILGQNLLNFVRKKAPDSSHHWSLEF